MNKKSFTLIELLVVIAIIGILAGVIIVSMTSAINSANDAKRKADINQLVKALLIYNTSHSEYPVSTTACNIGSNCSSEVNTALGSGVNAKDPQSGNYYSYWSDGTNFTVSANMSNATTYTYSSSTGLYGSAATGVCGSAANTEHSSIPSTNLCTIGTASSVTGDGVPYTWTCDTTPCEATKTGWINTGLGFYVMKYEAKIQGNDNGNQTYSSSYVAESRSSGTPWVNINQTQAIAECSALGSGYHLITNAEWTAIARNITAQASNWSTGTVGSGVLSRGYSASTTNASDGFTNNAAAPNTGTGYEYNTAANTLGSSGNFTLKRTHNLQNNQIIWDLAGNVWEWNSDTCTQGTGTGNWYNSGAWIEWNDSNLTDYELGIAGPSPVYTSSQNVGRYCGCTTTGNGLFRGGNWYYGLSSGVLALNFDFPSSSFGVTIGFRCTK
ncbi:prepilin-type N-terminal cleavage/methylation domain-containing protein [bacterium]|nr:prepilin-type N-terminal cleavage/methylation domain-containing protein [bacterium]